MAAPSIGSGITRLDASNQNTYTSGTFGTSGGSIASSDLGVSGGGIDPSNTSQGIENANGPATNNGTYYSARSPHWTGVDFSSANQAIVPHFNGNIGQFNRVDNVRLCVFSGGGTTEYAEFDIGSSSDSAYTQTDFVPAPLLNANITRESGSFDNTDVSGFFIAYEPDSNGNFGVDMKVDQIIHIDGEVEFADGDGTTQGNFKEYRDLLYRLSGETYHSMLNEYLPPAYAFGHAVRINSVEFSDSSFTFIFLPIDSGNWYNVPATGYYSLTIDPSTATAEHTYTDGTFAFDSGTYDLTIDASSLTTGFINVTRCVFLQTEDVVLDGADLTMTDCTITNPATCDIANADLTISINNCTAAIQWTADLIAGSAITTDSDIDITFAETDLSDITITLTASNTITVSPTTGSGTYDLSGLTTTGTVTLDNATANNTTITLPAGTSNTVASPTTGGGTITVDSPSTTFTINTNVSALIQIYTTNTQTILDSTTGTSLAYVHSGQTVDYTIQAAGYIPQRFTSETLSGTTSITVNLVADPVYNASHTVVWTTDYSYNASTRVMTIVANEEGRDLYSALIDDFQTETALRNCPFPLVAIGPDRIDFAAVGYYNSATTVGATIDSGDITFWKGAGMQWEHDTTGNPTKKFYSIKSSNTLVASSVVGYTQVVTGTPVEATLVSNQVNQVIQFFEDTNGDGTPDYNYTGHLLFKGFLTGYYQARWDVVNDGGVATLEPYEYGISLTQDAIAGTTGDQAITITTLTDHTGAPISVGGKSFDYELVDPGTNDADDLLSQVNYDVFNAVNTSISGTLYTSYQAFDLPDLLVEAGSNIETEYGNFEGDGAVSDLSGVYCSRSSADHPGISRFQSNDGTYYTPAVQNQATITNLPTAAGADTLLQIYNNTTATETYAADPNSATYNEVYTEGTTYTDGDEIRIRFAELDGATSFKSFETIVTAGPTGWSLNAANFIVSDEVYATNAIDGSTVTKFNYSAVDDQFNLAVAANFLGAELFAFYCFTLTTTAGIEGAFGAFVAENAGNYKNITAVASIFLDNETTASQRQTDTSRIYRDDDVYPVLDPTTSGFGIDINWQNVVYVVSTGGSALTTAEKAQLSNASSTGTTAVSQNELLIQDQGLDLSNPKVITEITEGESYDEDFDTINKTIRKVGNTTTITRTS